MKITKGQVKIMDDADFDHKLWNNIFILAI